MNTETHNERAAVIRAELAEHFKDVRELESRPQADGTFRRVFGLSAPTAIPYMLATFMCEYDNGSAVNVKMHYAQRVLAVYASGCGGVPGMLSGIRRGVMNTRIDAESGAVTCLRAALRDGTPLAALIDERFQSVAPKAASFEHAQRRVVAAIEQAVRQTTAAGQVVTKIDVGFHCNMGPEPITVTLNPNSLTEPTPGCLLAAARATGRARIHSEPAPVAVPPSTMAELRRLGARPLCTVEDGARYDFDEVP